jgi:hypothetical protein
MLRWLWQTGRRWSACWDGTHLQLLNPAISLELNVSLAADQLL